MSNSPTTPNLHQEAAMSDLEQSAAGEKQPSASEFDAPPDGGMAAWTQAALMHLVFFNTWGVANGFGVFQEYYSKSLGQSQSSIAWIGSVQVFLLFLIGVVAGRASDAGHFRIVFAIGVLLQLIGIFMTSLCTKYWQIFLAQAVCIGLGNGFTFVPALSITSSYFSRKRAFAVGVGAAGAGTGGLVYPTVIDQLLNHGALGFPWTLRIMGFIMLATYIPCLVLFRPRSLPRKSRQLIELSALKELPFLFFTFSQFFNFLGLYFAFFYMGTFARDRIGVSQPINLVMLLNGIGIISRVVPNVIADRWTGLFNIIIPLSFSASLLVFCWAGIHSESGLYVFTALYGLVAAALQSLYPAAATTMSPEANRTGSRVGLIFSFVSFATLTGPAISGALIEQDDGNYLYAQMFAGSSIFLGACFAVASVTGAGKTTLLDVLACRTTVGHTSGDIFINGDHSTPPGTFKEEWALYSKLLSTYRPQLQEKLAYVDYVLKVLHVDDYADAIIGFPGEGLNVEQRKRLYIAVEMVATPDLVLFLVHQLLAQLFSIFDRLLLLKAGSGLYFGDIGKDASILRDYFESMGARKCVSSEYPAEWMLKWEHSSKRQEALRKLKSFKIDSALATAADPLFEDRQFAVSIVEQALVLVKRVLSDQWRDLVYLYTKITVCIGLSLINGISFFNFARNVQGLINLFFSTLLVSQLFTMLSSLVIPRFMSSRDIFESREDKSKSYCWLTFIIANMLVEMAWFTLMSIIFFVYWYYPTGM
ncbi:ABC multidrug transporter atrG [Paramyrothecium foliicola]|nr:ABC multidrug transporter atrG [Paramyrothecium foliicola]